MSAVLRFRLNDRLQGDHVTLRRVCASIATTREVPEAPRSAARSKFASRPSKPSLVSTPNASMRLLDTLAALGPLLEPTGKPIADVGARLAGKRVGFYFSAGWCPMCTSFEPTLLAFREEAA